MIKKRLQLGLTAVCAAVLLAACGGGGTDGPGSAAAISRVKVIGDSIADSGVFQGLPGYGRIFSVGGSSSEPNVVWTERIAAAVGAPALCPVFRFTGTTFVGNSITGCTSYGVGGGRINNPASAGGAASPFSILNQMQAAVAGGNYAAGDLLLMDGGGNDAADLVGAYLAAAKDGGATYSALLASQVPAATLQATLASANGTALAGGVYMKALADTFYNGIKTYALDRGATRIAVLNMPIITLTPRFQYVLDGIAAASGGGTVGATARAQAEGLFNSWIQAFNAQLAARAAGDSRVVVVDFYTNFKEQVENPAQFGLTNAKNTACPPVGVGTDGLPVYNFATCTATALASDPRAAAGGALWWERYAFSDGFHPTPYGHQLMSQLVSRSLAQAGWL